MPDPSDSRYRTTAAEAAQPTTSDTAPEPKSGAERPPERWVDRLLLRLGLKSSTSARQNLEEVLEETAQPGAGFSPSVGAAMIASSRRRAFMGR